MRELIAVVVACCFLVTACAPSLSYRLGQGYYSETFAKTQVQAAANAGKVKHLGRFSVDAGGCGNYSQDATDENIVFPAIKSKLKELGANVADNVVANEQWYDFLLGLLVIPGLMACSNWTISGEALLVDQSTMNELQKMANLGKEQPHIFFKNP
jgi:hypothetical protein